MTKVMVFLLRISLVLLLVGIVFSQTILQVFFAPPAPEIATEVARPRNETYRLNDAESKGPSSDISSTRKKPLSEPKSQETMASPEQLLDEQGEREALANEESLQLTSIQPANADLTELEKLQIEQQRLLDEQAEREAAAYEESLQSTSGPQANADLTELEKLQIEQQRLLDEQAEREAAAYEESLQSTNRPQANADLKRR